MNRTYNFEKVFEQVRQNIDLPERSVWGGVRISIIEPKIAHEIDTYHVNVGGGVEFQ